jgi:hypothetical protein
VSGVRLAGRRAVVRQRRAGDGAPVLRGVVDAVIDGRPVAWDRAEARGRTPGEREMTRQVRAVSALSADPAVRVAAGARLVARLGWLARVCRGLGVSSVLAAWRGSDAVSLAALAADVQRARSPREVAGALATHASLAVGSPVVAVVSPGVPAWTVLVGEAPPLLPDAAVAALLACAEDAIRVDPDASVYPLLPDGDRAWLARAGVATLVPIAAPDGRSLAGLLVGARADGRPHSRRDRACLAAAASMAAVALGALECHAGHAGPAILGQLDSPAGDDLSFECEACGRVADASGSCPCGGARHLAALPSRLHGTFEVQRRIGRGGMGVAYLARDTRLDRPVVLKTLPCVSPGRAASIRAEARAMAAVEHPQVAVLYGLEEWRGTPVLVVEYLPGGTLASRLASGPMAVPDALALGASIAEALGALHARGWLHGDVKPSNIGFGRGGGIKLLDFGLSRWAPVATDTGPWADRRTAGDAIVGDLAGTPLYLSPDLLDGQAAGAPDDVWALSVVLVEMLTGRHPFRASDREAVLARVRRRAPIDLRGLAPALPPAVAGLLSRALHPHLAHRLATAEQLAAALRVVASGS